MKGVEAVRSTVPPSRPPSQPSARGSEPHEVGVQDDAIESHEPLNGLACGHWFAIAADRDRLLRASVACADVLEMLQGRA